MSDSISFLQFRKQWLVVLFFLTACSAPASMLSPTPTLLAAPTITHSISPTLTSEKTPSAQPSVTPTNTPIPPTVTSDPKMYLNSEFLTLPAGKYLVYWGTGDYFCGLKAVTDTQEEYTLASMNCNLESDQEPILSSNAQYLYLQNRELQLLYNLTNNQVVELSPSSREDCIVYSVSWNGRWIAGRCGNPEHGFTLALRSINSDWTTLKPLPHGVEESINFPTFSPDGTMLAFSNSTFGESKGVYIIDVNSCMDNLSTCSTTLRGPYWKDSTDYIAWSPDGKEIAITLSHTIITYDIASKREKYLVDFTQEGYWLHGAAWSPDGKWIGYARDKEPNRSVPMDLYLIPSSGGSSIFLTDNNVVQVVAWLNVEP